MANVFHKNLTGAELHEPKGIEGASVGDVYIADGSGSGVWGQGGLGGSFVYTRIGLDANDTTTQYFFPVPVGCSFRRIVTISRLVTNAGAELTIYNKTAGTTIGTHGLTDGLLDAIDATAFNSAINQDSYIRLQLTTGGGGGNYDVALHFVAD